MKKQKYKTKNIFIWSFPNFKYGNFKVPAGRQRI